MDNNSKLQEEPKQIPATQAKPVLKIKHARHNFPKTQEVVAKLEQKLGGKIMCYFTPSKSSMLKNHADLFLDLLKDIPQQENLYLVMITNGGDPDAPLRIANIVREYCKNFYVIVPSNCASAGTILSLAANKILMTPSGYLTPIDVSLTTPMNPTGADNKPSRIGVDQIQRLVKMLDKEGQSETSDYKFEGSYRTLFKYIHPLAIASVDRSSAASEKLAIKMMNMHPQDFESSEKIQAIAMHLIQDFPNHGYPILYSEAKEIGLPVEKCDPELISLLRDLVRFYAVAEMPAVTTIDELTFIYQMYGEVIEMLNKRITFRYDFIDKFSSIVHSWEKLDDKSQWVIISKTQNPNKPFLVSAIDYVEPPTTKTTITPETGLPQPPTPNSIKEI